MFPKCFLYFFETSRLQSRFLYYILLIMSSLSIWNSLPGELQKNSRFSNPTLEDFDSVDLMWSWNLYFLNKQHWQSWGATRIWNQTMPFFAPTLAQGTHSLDRRLLASRWSLSLTLWISRENFLLSHWAPRCPIFFTEELHNIKLKPSPVTPAHQWQALTAFPGYTELAGTYFHLIAL